MIKNQNKLTIYQRYFYKILNVWKFFMSLLQYFSSLLNCRERSFENTKEDNFTKSVISKFFGFFIKFFYTVFKSHNQLTAKYRRVYPLSRQEVMVFYNIRILIP